MAHYDGHVEASNSDNESKINTIIPHSTPTREELALSLVGRLEAILNNFNLLRLFGGSNHSIEFTIEGLCSAYNEAELKNRELEKGNETLRKQITALRRHLLMTHLMEPEPDVE